MTTQPTPNTSNSSKESKADDYTPEQLLEIRTRYGFKCMLRDKGIRHTQEFIIALSTGAPMPKDLTMDRDRFVQIGRAELALHFEKVAGLR